MLQIRYHLKFKGSDTLLFAGSRDDIDLLHSFFLGWKGEEVELVQRLQAREKLYLASVAALRLQHGSKDSFTWQRDNGTWVITAGSQQQIIGLLEGLLESNDEGHQYLDSGESPIQIIVAKDEYPLPEL
jgi:hypothetical protein